MGEFQLGPEGRAQLEDFIKALDAEDRIKASLTSDYTGGDEFKIGDRVTYHGSLVEYHSYEFTIVKFFNFNDVPCVQLQGPRMSIWIERCRVANITLAEEARD